MSSEKSLFRQQALQYSTQRFYGDINSLNKVNTWILITFIFGIVAVALGYLTTAKYSKTQVVSGYINPKEGLVSIHARRNGAVLAELYVSEGAEVNEGDKLALFSNPNRMGSGQSADIELIEDLNRTLRNLKEISEQQDQLSVIELERLNAQLQESTRELDIQTKFAAKYRQRLLTQKSLYKARRDLFDRGVLSNAQWLGMKSEFLEYEASLIEAEQRIQEHLSRVNSIRYQIAQHPIESAREKRELDLRISEVARQITQVQDGQSELLVAPVSGRVVSMQYSVGDTSFSNVPLMSIVPSDSELEGVVLLPSAAIGFLAVGQNIQLRLDAYPHQQYGTHSGRISAVSGAPVSGSKLGAPMSVTGSVYIAKAELQSNNVKVAGQEKPLQPGMLFSADVLLERRTFMEWILEPFINLKGRAA